MPDAPDAPKRRPRNKAELESYVRKVEALLATRSMAPAVRASLLNAVALARLGIRLREKCPALDAQLAFESEQSRT
ncbi:MAG: hypothetical protein IPK81_06525 [Rhodospirillales bacterium]|nr:MAG: hypothetical protein IPK81_06525 [Rhodospirillales bacterium]